VLRLRFGPFTFDAESRQLFRGEAVVHLSPKGFELLKMLLESRPRALSKAELQHHLWPDTFVSEANLPLLVGEIRRALHDVARRPHSIRTLQRFGYAFCGTVTEISGAAQPLERRRVNCWLVWKRQRLELVDGENLVGREPQSAVCLDLPSVSRRHARIMLTGAEAVLEDLGSKNGTYLRGTRVKAPAHLRDGDPIRFGSVLATFRIWSADAPTETRRAR
jgi:DNA-binding winged helix-turn-helix (wHTH) protein